MNKQTGYKPKPFTPELAVQAAMDMDEPLDTKRTLCNVIKQAYRCSHEDSYNITALRALLLEALWMGKRITSKLERNAADSLNKETPVEKEEFTFSVDWNEDLSQGNWD